MAKKTVKNVVTHYNEFYQVGDLVFYVCQMSGTHFFHKDNPEKEAWLDDTEFWTGNMYRADDAYIAAARAEVEAIASDSDAVYALFGI